MHDMVRQDDDRHTLVCACIIYNFFHECVSCQPLQGIRTLSKIGYVIDKFPSILSAIG